MLSKSDHTLQKLYPKHHLQGYNIMKPLTFEEYHFNVSMGFIQSISIRLSVPDAFYIKEEIIAQKLYPESSQQK